MAGACWLKPMQQLHWLAIACLIQLVTCCAAAAAALQHQRHRHGVLQPRQLRPAELQSLRLALPEGQQCAVVGESLRSPAAALHAWDTSRGAHAAVHTRQLAPVVSARISV